MEVFDSFILNVWELTGIYHKRKKLDLVVYDTHAHIYRHNRRNESDIYFSTQETVGCAVPHSNFTYPANLRGRGLHTPDGKLIGKNTQLKIHNILTETGLQSFLMGLLQELIEGGNRSHDSERETDDEGEDVEEMETEAHSSQEIPSKSGRRNDLEPIHIRFVKKLYQNALDGVSDPIQKAIKKKRRPERDSDESGDEGDDRPAKKPKQKKTQPPSPHHVLTAETFADMARLYAAANLRSGGTLETFTKSQKNLLGTYTFFEKCFPRDPLATFTCCDLKFMRTNFQSLYGHYRVEHLSKTEQVNREEGEEAKQAKIEALVKSFLPDTGAPDNLQVFNLHKQADRAQFAAIAIKK